MRLGMIGIFWNTFLPGAVGGDIIKATFLAREQSRRTVAVATVIMDRALALWALASWVLLRERNLVSQEDNRYQYRFRDIVDLDSGRHLFTVEHEVRSVTHPMYLRPLVNRNPTLTNQNYSPGYDQMPWAIDPEQFDGERRARQ